MVCFHWNGFIGTKAYLQYPKQFALFDPQKIVEKNLKLKLDDLFQVQCFFFLFQLEEEVIFSWKVVGNPSFLISSAYVWRLHMV